MDTQTCPSVSEESVKPHPANETSCLSLLLTVFQPQIEKCLYSDSSHVFTRPLCILVFIRIQRNLCTTAVARDLFFS